MQLDEISDKWNADINVVYWDNIALPYDHAFVVGPFMFKKEKDQNDWKKLQQLLLGLGWADRSEMRMQGPYAVHAREYATYDPKNDPDREVVPK